MDTFTTWLKTKLKDYGWTQAELSRRSGLSNATISNLVNEQTIASYEICLRLSKAFKLPLNDVLYNAGLEDKKPTRERLHSLIDMLKIEDIAILERIAKALIRENL